MRNVLLRTLSFAVSCIGVLILVAAFNERLVSKQLSETTAAQLVGGANCEGESVVQSCCVFNNLCDGTEILCSSNSTVACMAGTATGFRLVAVDSRDDCSATSTAQQGTCTKSYTEETCSYDTTCIWDSQLGKCIEDAPSDNRVPVCCTDTCTGN